MTTTATPTLFRQGWKAELESDMSGLITALHMNTSSVYRLVKNFNVAIVHSAPYLNNGHSGVSVDQFAVTLRTEESPGHSTTRTLKVFATWQDAFNFANLVY